MARSGAPPSPSSWDASDLFYDADLPPRGMRPQRRADGHGARRHRSRGAAQRQRTEAAAASTTPAASSTRLPSAALRDTSGRTRPPAELAKPRGRRSRRRGTVSMRDRRNRWVRLPCPLHPVTARFRRRDATTRDAATHEGRGWWMVNLMTQNLLPRLLLLHSRVGRSAPPRKPQ